MSDEELFTRLFYYGMAHLHMTREDTELTPIGELLDLWECHKQYNGMATPLREHYIDEIFPDGI